jgi:hypothetical protein
MRFPRSVVGLVAFACSLHSTLANNIGGIAGSIDNAAEAASLQVSNSRTAFLQSSKSSKCCSLTRVRVVCPQTAAKLLSPGSYILKNVATGQTLTYNVRSPLSPILPRLTGRVQLQPDGNDIHPSSSPGSPVTISHYGNGVNWVRLAIGGKNKCLSSQWGGAFNHAAVMYACAVASGGEIIRSGNTLEPTKQYVARGGGRRGGRIADPGFFDPFARRWWLLVPVDDYTGDSTASNHFLLAAQQDSVKTRQKAIKAGTFKKANAKRSTTAATSAAENHQRRAGVSRKNWRDFNGKGNNGNKAVKKQEEKKTNTKTKKQKQTKQAKKIVKGVKKGTKKVKVNTHVGVNFAVSNSNNKKFYVIP